MKHIRISYSIVEILQHVSFQLDWSLGNQVENAHQFYVENCFGNDQCSAGDFQTRLITLVVLSVLMNMNKQVMKEQEFAECQYF